MTNGAGEPTPKLVRITRWSWPSQPRTSKLTKIALVYQAACGYIRPASTKARFIRRRGGRVVECTALEMRHARKGIGGSNPSLSDRFSVSIGNHKTNSDSYSRSL